MVKGIMLEEIIVGYSPSKEKRQFLELCAKRIDEAVGIWVEISPDFDSDLAGGALSADSLVIYGSKHYDAEIVAGDWCYIDFVLTNKESKYRVNVHRADREKFLFDYRGQEFLIHYGKIPKKIK